MTKRIIVAITGASGAAYAVGLLRRLHEAGVEIHLVASPYGRRLLRDEMNIGEISDEALLGVRSDALTVYSHGDLGCRLASGSFLYDGMVVVPASTNAIGKIASGLGDDLIARAASVTLKERRRLILVPREMPLSHIVLENLLRLSSAGAIVCPACPGFYLGPNTVDDLVDFVAGRIMDLLDIDHDLPIRWAEK
jgi:4-hydroxy-3-polyprenylbenzoate decarboxylase